jgi:hypothetical protein
MCTIEITECSQARFHLRAALANAAEALDLGDEAWGEIDEPSDDTAAFAEERMQQTGPLATPKEPWL